MRYGDFAQFEAIAKGALVSREWIQTDLMVDDDYTEDEAEADPYARPSMYDDVERRLQWWQSLQETT